MIDEINTVITGDCLEEMAKFSADTFDGIITDPPYGLGFMGKDWDTFAEAKATHKEGHYITKAADGSPVRHQKGFSAASAAGLYDHSRNAEFQQWFTVWAVECLRIAKPGAIMLCFGGTRTYHRLTCAIEDAGWQIRDCVGWFYGSGFPKSANISLMFDRQACREQLEKELGRKPTKKELKKAWEGFRKVLGIAPTSRPDTDVDNQILNWGGHGHGKEQYITEPQTDPAKLWDGYGTALKPAWEPIVVAMKPLDGTFAQNAEKWGVAGLNIDGGRIGYPDGDDGYQKGIKRAETPRANIKGGNLCTYGGRKEIIPSGMKPQGRFPANVILDEEAGAMLDEQSGVSKSVSSHRIDQINNPIALNKSTKGAYRNFDINDSGGASRFFYCAKASRSERNAGLEGMEEGKSDHRWNKAGKWTNDTTPSVNNHPTVKPLKLMEYLCRLVKPPSEHPILLDPFTGSGTTLMAAVNTGWDYVGIEKEKEYCLIADKRIAWAIKQRQGQQSLFEREGQ